MNLIKIDNYKNHIVIIASIFLTSILVYRLTSLYLLDEFELIRYVPDDAFYYMVLAKNFLTSHSWTFDTVNSASGFHLVYAYVLVFIYKIFGVLTFKEMFLLAGIGNILLYVLSFVLITKSLTRKSNATSVLGVLIVFLSPFGIQNTTYMMESMLPIFFGSVILFMAFYVRRNNKIAIILIFLAGFLGEVSRTDFGASVFLLLITTLVLSRIYRNSDYIFPIAMAFIGAILGLLFVFGHNFYFFDHAIQNSALVKSYWSSIYGYNAQLSMQLIMSDINLGYTSLFILFVFLVWNFRQIKDLEQDTTILAAAAVLILSFYILFYGKNSAALQAWYISNTHIYVAVLIGIIFSILSNLIFKFVGVLIAFNAFFFSIDRANFEPWKHQSSMLQTAKYLKEMAIPYNSKIGSWNAGIVSWYSGKNIINLDGLVNDSIYPHLKNQTLCSYIKESKIEYIVDFEAMFNDQKLKKRGGYNCIEKQMTMEKARDFSFPEKWLDSNMVLYRIHYLSK